MRSSSPKPEPSPDQMCERFWTLPGRLPCRRGARHRQDNRITATVGLYGSVLCHLSGRPKPRRHGRGRAAHWSSGSGSPDHPARRVATGGIDGYVVGDKAGRRASADKQSRLFSAHRIRHCLKASLRSRASFRRCRARAHSGLHLFQML